MFELFAVITNIRSQLSDRGQSSYIQLKSEVKAEGSLARAMSVLDFKRLLVTGSRLRLTSDELDLLVSRFPSRKADAVDADAVVTALRCPLSERRKELVAAAFASLPVRWETHVTMMISLLSFLSAVVVFVRGGEQPPKPLYQKFPKQTSSALPTC